MNNGTRRRHRSSNSSTRYSSARTLRSSNTRPIRDTLNPDRDPEELLALIFQLTTTHTQIRPRMERPQWTVREARATLRSFVRKVGTLEGTAVWANPDFQRELKAIRESSSRRITHAALIHAFRSLTEFVEKWDAQISDALYHMRAENRASLFR
jgi:hypothetical protein